MDTSDEDDRVKSALFLAKKKIEDDDVLAENEVEISPSSPRKSSVRHRQSMVAASNFEIFGKPDHEMIESRLGGKRLSTPDISGKLRTMRSQLFNQATKAKNRTSQAPPVETDFDINESPIVRTKL